MRIDQRGAVAWLTLDRPERLNALDSATITELSACFDALRRDAATRIVVLRGEGRAFCAGLDLQDAPGFDLDVAGQLELQRSISEIVMKMRYCPQPIISLVRGAACGGGFALALASDIRIAGESARMNAAFIRLGLSACDVGVSYFLPRLVGASLAAELMFTGDFIDAARALQLGLVSRVVPDEALESAAEPLIAAMLSASPLGLRLTKECLRLSIDAPSLEAAIAMEDRNQVICATGAEFREGVAAFLEKGRRDTAAVAEGRS
jgi:enoyl-CoA hydratase